MGLNKDELRANINCKFLKLKLVVQDNGVGIKKENISRLFHDYNRLDEHKEMNAKGTGLGLSICKKLIDQMGGKVIAESKLGIGTRFIITVQLRSQQIVEEEKFSDTYSFTKNFHQKFKSRDNLKQP